MSSTAPESETEEPSASSQAKSIIANAVNDVLFGEPEPEEEVKEKEKVRVNYDYLADDVDVQRMSTGQKAYMRLEADMHRAKEDELDQAADDAEAEY